jgi:hypothetical protein
MSLAAIKPLIPIHPLMHPSVHDEKDISTFSLTKCKDGCPLIFNKDIKNIERGQIKHEIETENV